MKSHRLLILLTAVLCGSLLVAEGTSSLIVQGTGSTLRKAVTEALILAVEQHNGVQISDKEKSTLYQVESSTSSLSAEQNTLTVDDSFRQEASKWSEGRIQSFDIKGQSYDPATQKVTVTLEVFFPQAYVVGLNPQNRRRMAVGAFELDKPSFSLGGTPVSALSWTDAFKDALHVQLTQSRKFTMLERKFDDEVNRELARLAAPNASPADTVRLSQKLGTDYLLVGTIMFHNVPPMKQNPFTGQWLPPESATFATVTYRVLLAPTGQLKWADTVHLDAAAFMPTASAADFLLRSSTEAAVQVADSILGAIYPFEVAAVTADGQIIIGEGGKSIDVGELLDVYAVGETILSPQTGEVLDVLETKVATIQVQRVTEKLSYAVLVDGDASKIAIGSRLHREQTVMPAVTAPVPPPPPPPPTTTVQPLTNGGVNVNF